MQRRCRQHADSTVVGCHLVTVGHGRSTTTVIRRGGRGMQASTPDNNCPNMDVEDILLFGVLFTVAWDSVAKKKNLNKKNSSVVGKAMHS